jgi:hypothetical protein
MLAGAFQAGLALTPAGCRGYITRLWFRRKVG